MKRTLIKRRPMADTVLATLEPEAKEYREHDGGGLYLRVKPTGEKSWQFRLKRPDGKWTWLGLGSYPAVGGALARDKAAELRAAVAAGNDPLEDKRQQLQAIVPRDTFELLAREWLESKTATWTDGTATRNVRALEKHVFPAFGPRPIGSISSQEWLEHLRRLEATGIVEQTGRVRALCIQVYDLARVTGRAEHNPLDRLSKFLSSATPEGMAHVSPEEVPDLMRAIRAYRGAPDVRIGLQLLAMLACRPSELREAQWAEFNLESGLWCIPADRMKMRRPHSIPLPTQAVELLRNLHTLTGSYPLLFPGRNDTTKPRANTVWVMALRRLGYEGKQTAHGFRHLFSTAMNEQGYNRDHIEAQLAHGDADQIRAAYNKAEYLEQRRIMVQAWADHLDGLVAGNVVEFKRA